MKLRHIIPLIVGFLSIEAYAMIHLNRKPHATNPCQDEYSRHLQCPHPEHRGEVVNDHLLCKCVRP